MRNRVFSAGFVGFLVLAGCNSSSGGPAPTGGATSNGGQPSGGGTGGSVGSGGAQNSGGKSASGGTTTSGGAPGSGGATQSGGTTGSGGAMVSGGSTGRGGATASGGATGMGGATGSGGATAAGGAGGGQANSGGQTTPGTGAGGKAGGIDGGGQSDGGFFTSSCGGTPWPTADPSAPGSFKVTADKNVGPVAGAANDPVYGDTKVQFNVYRPTTLGSCHPIILWGNGHTDNPEPNPPKCLASNYCGDYLTILNQLASHGFVIIASLSTITSQPDPATGLLPQLVGMNWIVQQNEDSTSPYYHHLDVSRIGATGHSEGAFATSTIGSDSHISAIATMAGATATPNLHEPALFLCGGQDTQVPCSNIQKAFDAITTTPVMLEENPTASHGSWIGSIKDPYEVAVTAWMRVHLMNDTANRSMFYGANCKLCQDTQLKVQRKNMDQ